MASFEAEYLKTKPREGGFQNHEDDKANYVNGVLIGTNLGISAQAYYGYYKKIPTVEQMKALTVEQAMKIYKSNYWDKIAGDYIINQSVAALMFQFIIGSWVSQLSDIKDIANDTFGRDVLVSNDLPITKSDAIFINSINQEKFHANLKQWRFNYYDRICLANPKLNKFKSGWQKRLNGHIFKEETT